jgi:hypothetical protein
MIHAIALSFLLFIPLLAAASDPLHIPLSRYPASVPDLDDLANAGARLRKRYSTDVLDKRQGIPLIDLVFSYYYKSGNNTLINPFSKPTTPTSRTFQLAHRE